jgi:hypothetical protein
LRFLMIICDSALRLRFAAIAARIETTVGADSIGGTPAAADVEIDFDPVTGENPDSAEVHNPRFGFNDFAIPHGAGVLAAVVEAELTRVE